MKEEQPKNELFFFRDFQGRLLKRQKERKEVVVLARHTKEGRFNQGK